MRDPRVAKLIRALARRFPGTTIVRGPMRDAPGSGEVRVDVLNAPMDPPGVVFDVASRTIDELWGDDPCPAFVGPVCPEQSARYYAKELAKARRTRGSRRRARAAVPRKRAAAR